MKKSLLAMAVAAAVPAVATAQVTISGLLDIGLTNIDNGAKSKLFTTTGDRSSNNITFRGVEDIGGGLRGIFHVELGFDVDTGHINSTSTPSNAGAATIGFARRSILGLAGSFGEIRAGRDYTPIFSASNANSIHGTSGYASNLTYMNAAGGGTGVAGIDIRYSNALLYSSPVFQVFQVNVAYTTGAGSDDINPSATPSGGNTKNGEGSSLALVYSAGPAYAQVSWQSVKDQTGTGTASVDSTGPGKRESVAYGGKYKFGDFELALGAANTEASTVAGLVTKNETVFYGASYTMGPTRFSVQGATVKVSGTSTAANVADNDYTTLTLLVNHALSKRTAIYGNYGKVSNDARQNVGIRSNGFAVNAAGLGVDPSAFGVGVVHSF